MRSFLSALDTSTLRKSSGLSMRRRLRRASWMLSHSRPMMARSTEHDSSSFLMNLRKSAPGGMLSVSLKIRSAPKWPRNEGSRASAWPELSSRR